VSSKLLHGIEKFDVFAHVPVDVVSLNETAKRVGVCEEKCTIVTIFGLQVIITRSPAIAEGPRDAGVPVEIW